MTARISEVADLQAAIAECSPGTRLVPIAGGSKPALSARPGDWVQSLDVSGLTGVVQYNPAELTFTAMASTPVAEMAEVLAAHGQYLPFDPPLTEAGATLGGTVAAGVSGSNALRHGGVRDFVIGVRFVDGTGRVVSGGGKVVKNAAGFDFPKLLVGSLGRLGVMVQLSFKVFPRPRATRTLEFEYDDTQAAVAAACHLSAGPRELDAVDVLPEGRLLVRLGGEPEALPVRARRLVDAAVGNVVAEHQGAAELDLWRSASELHWVEETMVSVRVPLTLRETGPLARAVNTAGGSVRFALAANVAWVAWPVDRPLAELEAELHALGLRGLVLTGASERPLLGTADGCAFAAALRRALDPHHRFLEA